MLLKYAISYVVFIDINNQISQDFSIFLMTKPLNVMHILTCDINAIIEQLFICYRMPTKYRDPPPVQRPPGPATW